MRKHLLPQLFPIICIIITGFFIYSSSVASANNQNDITSAWQRAMDAGAYEFAADVEQTLVPRPVPGMIGQTDQQADMHLEGTINLPDQANLRLALKGAGLPSTNIELVQNGAETFLIKDKQRIPIQNPTNFSNPSADYLSYLAAADQVERCVPSDFPQDDNNNCYTFVIDGIRFAEYVRDQLQTQLKKSDTPVPPGVTLAPSSLLQRMSGSGMLFLDENGVPAHMVINLLLPEVNDYYDAQVNMTIDFSFDSKEVAETSSTETSKILTEVLDSPVNLAPSGMLVFLLILIMVFLFTSCRNRWLYGMFGTSMIIILLVTPVLQTSGIIRFQERQAQASPALTLSEALFSDNVPNIINDEPANKIMPYSALSTTSASAGHTLTCGDGDPNNDADGDNLSDADELCLGTDPEYVDSDRDVLTDTLEIDGFDYAGRHWASNPLKPDSNYDGLSDLAEWPGPVGAAPNLAGVNDWDPDGDGVPNIWDEDNDGDQVPDNLDLSPFTRSRYTSTVSLSTQGAGFNGYQYIEIQVQPQEMSHLRYSMSALDWPHDELGQIQDLDDSTEDIRLFPMLRIHTNQAPNRELAIEYGVSTYVQDDGTYVLYAPVSPVGQGGQIKAFSTKVAYGPDELDDIRWDQVELVWTIQLNQDKESNGEVTTSILPLGVQVEDSIRVSGFKITKTRNYQSAVIGTPDTQDNDRWLFNVLFGMSNTFLTHQDPGLQEIENRFNSPNTYIEQTWGVPSARVVVDLPTNPYGHTDEGTADISVRILNYLVDNQYADNVTPSLILAIEEEIGLYGLDDQGQFEPAADINLNLANVAMSTLRSLKSNTYRSVDGQWETLDLEETLDSIQQRYEGQLAEILLDLQDDYPDLTEDDLQLLLDMFYTAWFFGQTRILHIDGRDMAPQERDDGDVYNTFYGESDNLPAYLLEAAELGEPGGGLIIGDNQSQTWDYMRQQTNEIGFIDPALKLAGNIAAGLVKIILTLRTVNQAMNFASAVGGYSGMMSIFSNNAGAGSRRLGAVGAVLGVALIWATFGFSTDFSDPLAVNQAVAYSVVATVISISLFILSLNPIGAILVALFTLVDLLILISYGGTNNLTEMIILAIAEFFYSVDVLTTFQNVEFVDFDTQVMDQNLGLVVGNRIRITDECVGTIERNNEGDDGDLEDSWVDCAFSGSASGATGVNQNGNRQCTRNGSILTCTDPVGAEFYLDTAQRNVKLTVNSSVEAKTYYQECTFGGARCWRSAEYTDLPDDLPESDRWEPIEFYLDVLPANFLDLWTWNEIINPDADGDGLDNDREAELGANPNNWDSDGDGLSDDFEFENQESLGCDPVQYDTDGDSLSDGYEYRIGTGINTQDSDDDGLTDDQEVYHWNGAGWVGGWLVELPGRSVWVYSDPVVSDTDGDGMNDRSEKNLATSPYGYNPAPHLTLQGEPQARKPGGSEALYVDLNDLVSLTLTLQNENPNAADGTLTLCLPAFLTDIQGGVLQGDRTPPKEDAASCNGFQWSFSPPYALMNGEQVSTTISARVTGLAASASGEINATLPFRIGDVTENIADQVKVVADLEPPTVSFIAPPVNTLLGGGISRYVLGGSSNDVDCWVKQVQVELPGTGWVDAQGASPWAYTWELPSDGVYTLAARSIDFLDHVSVSATTAVTVDNTAPDITLDLSEGEIVTGESSRVFTITLTGDASDNLSGLKRVQISTDGRPWQEVWAGHGASLYESWNKDWIIPNQESAQGEHTVAARAVDQAGNISPVLERTFIIDILPPTSELTDRTYLNNPPPSVPTNQSLNLYGVANDEGNAPEPVHAIDLVGELDSLDDATIWLELSSIEDNSGGVSVTWIGDFNGDRLGDMAIGLPGAKGGKGQISIIYGRAGDWKVPTEAELLSGSPSLFIGAKGAALGEIIAPAGDVNGDGFADLLVGDPHNDTVYLVFGQAAFLGTNIELSSSRAPYWSQLVAPAGENIGTWLNPAGDVNGDGFDDLLISSTGASGKTYLLLGEPAPWWEIVELDVKAAAKIDTGAAGAFAIGIGDIDGDYFDEFAISTGNTVYLFEGRDTWYSMDGASLTLDDSIATFDSLDTMPIIAAVGDVDGDAYGLADFVYANGSIPTLVYGDLNRDWDILALDFTPAASGFVAAPGDVDADGHADILVGNTEGNAYLILGDDPSVVKATLTGVLKAASTPYAAGADLNADNSSDLLLVSGESIASGRSLSYTSLPHIDPDQLPTVRTALQDQKTSRALRAALSILNVNDDGTCQGGTPCYSNLQTAINAASDGDTINVEPGVYSSIIIDGKDNLTISGVYADAVFIDGDASAFAVKILNANGVKLENMTLRNANEIIYLDDAGVDGHEITENKIVLDTVLIVDFASHAVAMNRISSIQLSQCTLAGNDHFHIYGSPDPAVDANWRTVSNDSRTATGVRGDIVA
ncbi:MAG: FG-GAP repeat protein, partial [Anaerolineales bacterium]|nr:FG-GAP repeat protein [Anaerolineales bacterium]